MKEKLVYTILFVVVWFEYYIEAEPTTQLPIENYTNSTNGDSYILGNVTTILNYSTSEYSTYKPDVPIICKELLMGQYPFIILIIIII